ncbi:MAG TPA: OB-fold nucleic acid binding domain-containing protein [Methanomicrobiales archaeon]|nr:OB-fold nucleic acid binding domain-containing protein [Methanomicrobiales archaeon]
MSFHYALVDDLLSREEFDRRVEEVMEKSGDLLDEPTASMIVVRDLGRAHVKIRDVAGSSLSSFFGKVISTTSPHGFQRSDGTEGQVADILLGDETGQVRVVLWDEKAQAAAEVEVGEVLEVIAKPSPRGKGDVSAMAFRKADCEISCAMAPDRRFLPPEKVPELEVKVIDIGKTRTFARRDGSEGRMVELIVGNPAETSRLVCWEPDLLAGIGQGASVLIRGATRSTRGEEDEYRLNGTGEITSLDRDIDVPITRIGQIPESGYVSVSGAVGSAGPVRSFTTRQGQPSSVRNLTISDGSGEIPFVLWGDKAALDIAPGDAVSLYHVQVRRGRDGGPELHAGRGSAVVLPAGEAGAVELEGIVIPVPAGTCLDVLGECTPVAGDIPVGRLVRVRGKRVRRTIIAEEAEVREPDPAPVMERLARFRAGIGG